MEFPAAKNVFTYPCCVEPYPDLTYTIRVKRIATFYSFILVLPCVLLSLLTLVSFWLPPESPAKVLLGTSYVTKTCHFSFYNNLLVSCSICTVFVLFDTGFNILHCNLSGLVDGFEVLLSLLLLYTDLDLSV